jgi:hypothetical protein
MRVVLLALLAACGGSPQPAPPPAPVPAAAGSSAVASGADDQAIAPLPYTADQIRAASPAGRVIPLRVEVPGKISVQVFTFVTVDETGADIESSERDERGNPIGEAKRAHATWDELRHHAAFPRATTTIEDGVADTPAGRFASKVYIVTSGDAVSHFYFAVDRPGPPVLFYTDKHGTRVLTSTLLANADPPAPVPAPIACKTDDDCWLDGNRPIARPASERGKKLRPCKDSSRIPICKQQVCTLNAFKC